MLRRKPLTKTETKKRDTERRKVARAKVSAKKKRRLAAEQLWRDIVFTRAGRCCEICGKGPYEKGSFQLQAHHLVRRSKSKRLQLDPLNGSALCPGCHMNAERDPLRIIAIIEEKRPVAKYLLRERRSTEQRGIDVEEIILEQAWLEVSEWEF